MKYRDGECAISIWLLHFCISPMHYQNLSFNNQLAMKRKILYVSWIKLKNKQLQHFVFGIQIKKEKERRNNLFHFQLLQKHPVLNYET